VKGENPRTLSPTFSRLRHRRRRRR